MFWPKELYERERETKKVLQKSEEDLYDFQGKKLRGIIRDAKHGTPPGSITLTASQATKAQRLRTIEDGDKACREGQLDDTWKAIASTMSVSVKQGEQVDDGCEERFLLHQSKKPRVQLKGEDDSVDWDDILAPKVSKGQGQGGADSSSGESSRSLKVKKRKKEKARLQKLGKKPQGKHAKGKAALSPAKKQSTGGGGSAASCGSEKKKFSPPYNFASSST